MLKESASIDEETYNALPHNYNDKTMAATWSCIAKISKGMLAAFPKGKGHGIQTKVINAKAIKIPDRGDETYGSYVACIKNISAVCANPITKAVSESEK